MFYAACKREEVGYWIFQVEMSEFESIHGLGDQLDIKKDQGNASSQRNRVVFSRAPVKWSVMSLDALKFWIKDHSATQILTYRPSDFVHFVAFEIISANYDIFKAYFVEEVF